MTTEQWNPWDPWEEEPDGYDPGDPSAVRRRFMETQP